MLPNLAFYLTCFTLFFAPIPLGANRPWAWGLIEIIIAITSLLICSSFSTKKIIHRLKPSTLLLAVLTFVQFWVFAQWLGGQYIHQLPLASVDPVATQVSLIKGMSFVLFVLNLSVLIHTKKRQKTLVKIVIFSGIFQASYAIFLQHSNFSTSPLGFDITHRANGSFVYHNHLAGYLLLCLSVAIGYLLSSLKGINVRSSKQRITSLLEALLSEKWIIRIAIIIMVVALILTRSRMGNSLFFIAVLITSLLALMLMKKPPNTLKWLVLSLVVLDIVIVGAYFGIDKVKERMSTTSFQAETRDDVVSASIPYIKDYWLTGSGAGSFGSTFQQYQLGSYGGHYDHAHNEYVQFLTEFGVVPSMLLFSFVLFVFIKELRKIKYNKRYISLIVVMSFIIIIFHSFVDFIFQSYAIALTYLFILFLSFNHTDGINKQKIK